MTKRWSFADFEFALDSAWGAFENMLRKHGVTEKEVQKFVLLNDTEDNYNGVAGAFRGAITLEEE